MVGIVADFPRELIGSNDVTSKEAPLDIPKANVAIEGTEKITSEDCSAPAPGTEDHLSSDLSPTQLWSTGIGPRSGPAESVVQKSCTLDVSSTIPFHHPDAEKHAEISPTLPFIAHVSKDSQPAEISPTIPFVPVGEQPAKIDPTMPLVEPLVQPVEHAEISPTVPFLAKEYMASQPTEISPTMPFVPGEEQPAEISPTVPFVAQANIASQLAEISPTLPFHPPGNTAPRIRATVSFDPEISPTTPFVAPLATSKSVEILATPQRQTAAVRQGSPKRMVGAQEVQTTKRRLEQTAELPESDDEDAALDNDEAELPEADQRRLLDERAWYRHRRRSIRQDLHSEQRFQQLTLAKSRSKDLLQQELGTETMSATERAAFSDKVDLASGGGFAATQETEAHAFGVKTAPLRKSVLSAIANKRARLASAKA